MTTATKNRKNKATKTAPTSKALTATAVAELLASAKTASEKGTATRRLKAYVASRADAGCDASRVEANVRSLATRLGRGK